MFGVTVNGLRRLAFQIAALNHFFRRFNKDKEISGKKLCYRFMRRHPQLSQRQPQASSLAGAQNFSRGGVKEFFDMLEGIAVDNNLYTARIYTLNVIGLTAVQNKPRIVVSREGRAKICSVSSTESGENTTAVCCVRAAGYYVPPMMI
jgi:hypothetical protein